MPDSQPWRNPRPAPQLPEARSHLNEALLPNWLRVWWPAGLWACVIFLLSTESFSARHTAAVIERIVAWLFPFLTAVQVHEIHRYIRKTAHFVEYFIFCLLIYRGVRGGRTGWRWSWALTALFIAAGYSALDEVHQAFVAGRQASPFDSLIDSAGAFVAFAALWLWFHSRSKRTQSLTS